MKARYSLFAAMLVAACLLAPGQVVAQNYPDSIKQMVSAAKKQVPLVNMEQFEAGFTNVTSTDMVFENWVKAGYPVAKPGN